MAKRKLTPEILELIELCAADEYTLDDIREEADIVKPLMEDPRVLKAIEKGRVKWFIEMASTDGNIDSFIFYTGKSYDEVEEMFETHKEAIKLQKAEIKEENRKLYEKKVSNAKLRLSPSSVGESNIYLQEGEENCDQLDRHTLKEELELTSKRMQDGDTTFLLEILTANIMQLHHFNGQITGNLAGELGKKLATFEKLSNMQLKVMQETRKSIMAINEIINPKRTTFIKEANQHNHLHQNSEKKDESQNELQRQLEKPDEIMDKAVYVWKGGENEKK